MEHTKECTHCNEVKSFKDYRKDLKGRYGLQSKCSSCMNLLQRERRRKSGNSNTKNYEKTPNGFLMRLYRNMKSRVEGVQKEKFYLYVGKSLLSKEDFYEWSRNSEEFALLFNNWKDSNYKRTLTPSVDRVDSSKGYTLDNMEWVIFSENCRRASLGGLSE